MKFFQKILIGLCSLLPCFASVPQGLRGKTREIQKREYYARDNFQIQKPCDLKFLPSSSVSATNFCYQSNFSFDVGSTFAMSPSPDRLAYGANFLVPPVADHAFCLGFLLYSPLFDGKTQFVNQYQIFSSVGQLRPAWKPSLYLDNFVFIVNDTEVFSFTNSNSYIAFRFTLSIPYSNIDKNNGWFYLLPFVVEDYVSSEVLSSVGYGLYQGFLSGLSYSKPNIENEYQSGFDDGESSGIKKGYSQGYEAGKAVADQHVYQNGYNKGYSEGSSTLTPASTIWGLFGAIASVPTEILNGMGDIAIWNTPILAILFSLLFLALVLWIIRKFI